MAIPSLFFHRYFQRKIDELVIYMEQEALKLVEVLNTDRTDNPEVKRPGMMQAATR